MNLIALQQGSPAWHAWRTQGLTASDAVNLAGYWGGPPAVYAAKTGPIAPEPMNDAMRRGLELEPIARRCIESERAIMLRPGCGEHREAPVLRASFDGLGYTFDQEWDGRVFEIKCPTTTKWHQAGEIPDYYRPQLLHQATVADIDKVFFASYHPECTPRLRIQGVSFSQGERERHRTAMLEWWEAHVVAKVPPAAIEPAVLEREDRAWLQAAADYREWNAKAGEAEQKVAAIRACLIDLAGDVPRVRGGGLNLVTTERNGSVDYQKLVKQHCPEVDIELYRKVATRVTRIVVDD